MQLDRLSNLRPLPAKPVVENDVKPVVTAQVKSSNGDSLRGDYNLFGQTTKAALFKNSSSNTSYFTGQSPIKSAAPQEVAPVQFAPPAAPGQLSLAESKSVSDIAYDGKVGEVYQFADGTYWRVDKNQDDSGFFHNGFKAVAMRRVVADGNGGYKDDPTDNRVAVGFAGTDGLNDVDDDIDQALGQTPEQYQDGLKFTQQVRDEASKTCETVTATGHSLGGGIATYISIETGIPATAINSAPLSNNKVPDGKNFDGQITQYYAKGEILTDVDDANPTDQRPGKHVEIGARYAEREYEWYNFIGVAVDNAKISGQNHSLSNTAPEIAEPTKVAG